MAQMGFHDLSDRHASLDAQNDPLVEIDAVMPWEEFRPTLGLVWRKPDAERRSPAGRKPVDAVLMFKTLVVSALCNLSDAQIEDQVRDRLSFLHNPTVVCLQPTSGRFVCLRHRRHAGVHDRHGPRQGEDRNDDPGLQRPPPRPFAPTKRKPGMTPGRSLQADRP